MRISWTCRFIASREQVVTFSLEASDNERPGLAFCNSSQSLWSLRAHVHGDFCAKFVEYARKIQRNATFLLHRSFTVTTGGAQVMQEKLHVVARNGKTRG